MVHFSETLRQMARMRKNRRFYEQADVEPSFFVKCVDVDGYQVSSTSSEDAARVLQGILRNGNIDFLDVCLLLSPIEGVKVLNRDGEEILKHKICDIAYGGMDVCNPDYFLLVSNHLEGLRCYIYYCHDASQTRLLLSGLNRTFEIVQNMICNNNGSLPSSVDTIDNDIKNSLSIIGKIDVDNEDGNDNNSVKDIKQTASTREQENLKTKSSTKEIHDFHSGTEPSSRKLLWPRKLFGQRRKWFYEPVGVEKEDIRILL